MKHEWRKSEKTFYLPKQQPTVVELPSFQFLEITGEGNPNEEHFSHCVEVLYSISYALRMSHKGGYAPHDYFEYAVYPLEGIWDLREEVKQSKEIPWSKDDLVYRLMIRQPNFITTSVVEEALERTKKKKPHSLLDQVRFCSLKEGRCVQMLHLGSYDTERASFQQMEEFCAQNGLVRSSKQHREIYLSDARKVVPEKLKTVLRFTVQ
ncbi:MAG: GyrI-like domain-containing protein [Spirochaetales bacterium]|nr:GyrI-like domain-containing protein [Spirochaetales bacterium]